MSLANGYAKSCSTAAKSAKAQPDSCPEIFCTTRYPRTTNTSVDSMSSTSTDPDSLAPNSFIYHSDVPDANDFEAALPRDLPGYTPTWETSGQVCNYCAQTVFSPQFISIVTEIWNRKFVQSKQPAYKRRTSDLILASRRGCPWCGRLVAYLNGLAYSLDRYLNLLEDDQWVSCEFRIGIVRTSQNGKLDLKVGWRGLCFRLQLQLNTTIMDQGFVMFPELDKNMDLSSRECFNGIRSFRRQCHLEHGVGSSSSDVSHDAIQESWDRPSRVIDVGSLPMRLVDYSRSRWSEGYVALSYSWGQDHTYLLTRPRLKNLMETLDMSLMPATICDAISVSQRLDIRYLWVDAL